MREAHVVVPAGIDDPARPSGGNLYDRRLCDGLVMLGWTVHEHPVPGGWPRPTPTDEDRLEGELRSIPDDATLVVDGLIGSASPVVATRFAALARVSGARTVVLVHMPLAEADPAMADTERRTLTSASVVVTASHWARDWLVAHHHLAPARVHVVEPGSDPAAPATHSTSGHRLLSVAAVTPDKGHHTLLTALDRIRDLDWTCTITGALDVDPGYAADLLATVDRLGLGDRVRCTGPLPTGRLHELRSHTDLTVSASRRESYGMATAEALARATPVVATAVGGHPEAVGRAPDGTTPGLLVPPDDPAALANALRRWLTDATLRTTLRRAAARRRSTLPSWPDVAARFADVLDAEPPRSSPRVPQQTAKGG